MKKTRHSHDCRNHQYSCTFAYRSSYQVCRATRYNTAMINVSLIDILLRNWIALLEIVAPYVVTEGCADSNEHVRICLRQDNPSEIHVLWGHRWGYFSDIHVSCICHMHTSSVCVQLIVIVQRIHVTYSIAYVFCGLFFKKDASHMKITACKYVELPLPLMWQVICVP